MYRENKVISLYYNGCAHNLRSKHTRSPEKRSMSVRIEIE